MKYVLSRFGAATLGAVFASATFVVLAGAIPVRASSCVSLSHQLSYGESDYQTGGEVTALQNFLVSKGFMTVTPNGHFGPATLAGVEALQRAYGISPVGTVGPLTRAAIGIASCYAAPSARATTPTSPSQTSVASSQAGATAPASASGSAAGTPSAPAGPTSSGGVTISSPTSGAKLSMGDHTNVSWSGPGGSMFSVVLEDASGTPQGFIVPNTYAHSYSWQVGTVMNSSSASLVTVPPGTYRIAVESSGSGSGQAVSANFTIADDVSIAQVFPRTAVSDGATSVVVYGSGFKQSSMIDIYGYGLVGPAYVSADGTVIVFTVPTGVYPGAHGIAVSNSYGDSSARTESSAYVIQIING